MKRNNYNTKVVFEPWMIAPCGMNCGSCIGYMRPKDPCPGCRIDSNTKPAYCKSCIIINCEELKETTFEFCNECPKYPCARLKSLDKRYRLRYHTSFFENLALIRETGMDHFLAFETRRRTCPHCGATLSVHRSFCLHCGMDL